MADYSLEIIHDLALSSEQHMPIYSQTITHGLVFASAALGPVPDFDVDYVSGDLDFCVERVSITFRQAGTRESDALAGTLIVHSENITTVMAVRGLITVREIESFGGYLKTTDHKFRVSARDLAFIPKSGDKATSNGRTYEVIGVDRATFESAVGIFCRG